MAMTYDYQTRHVSRDFCFVRHGTKCKGSGLPCHAGSDRCRQCQYHGGSLTPLSFSIVYDGARVVESYVYCRHPDAHDSEGSGEAQRAFYDMMEQEALAALDY